METIVKYAVGTIQKGINVLNLFKINSKLSFTDIQKTLKYNKSTLFRILHTLEKNNFLSKKIFLPFTGGKKKIITLTWAGFLTNIETA